MVKYGKEFSTELSFLKKIWQSKYFYNGFRKNEAIF